MRLRLLFLALFTCFVSNAQKNDYAGDKTYFSEAISLNIKKYKKKVSKAYRLNNIERAEFLYDSLVNHCLKGTYIDNFNVNCLGKNKNCLNDFSKPIFLLTYASWCIPSKGEIPALNDLAKKHKKDIDFVVLFWDKKSDVRKVAGEYHGSIDIVYVDELDNRDAFIVRTMKHSLGFPTTFVIGSNKQLLDIRRTAAIPFDTDFEKAYTLNYQNISKSISEIIDHEKELMGKRVGEESN